MTELQSIASIICLQKLRTNFGNSVSKFLPRGTSNVAVISFEFGMNFYPTSDFNMLHLFYIGSIFLIENE